MAFKQIPNNDYYLFNGRGNTVYMVRATKSNVGVLNLGCVPIPAELVGKKVRIKLEVIEDGTG